MKTNQKFSPLLICLIIISCKTVRETAPVWAPVSEKESMISAPPGVSKREFRHSIDVAAGIFDSRFSSIGSANAGVIGIDYYRKLETHTALRIGLEYNLFKSNFHSDSRSWPLYQFGKEQQWSFMLPRRLHYLVSTVGFATIFNRHRIQINAGVRWLGGVYGVLDELLIDDFGISAQTIKTGGWMSKGGFHHLVPQINIGYDFNLLKKLRAGVGYKRQLRSVAAKNSPWYFEQVDIREYLEFRVAFTIYHSKP